MSQWGPASHGTIYGGNPIACAASLATIAVIREEGLMANARVQGAYMLDQLRELQAEARIIGDVRGIGLMIAAEVVKPGTKEPDGGAVARIKQRALDGGLLFSPCGHWSQTIRLIPPLTITRAQVDEGLDILRQAVLAEST